MAETTPDRLVAALTAAGWVQDGGEHAIAKFWWMAEEPPRLLVVPLDPSVPDYDGMIATVLRTCSGSSTSAMRPTKP